MKKFFVRLALGLLFAVPLMLFTFVIPHASGIAQASGLPADGAPVSGDAPVSDGSTAQCQTCHAEFYESWQTSGHHNSFSNDAFQQLWQDAGQPGDCLNCHTTGYNAVDGTYLADNINCLACHAAYTDKHPAENMPVDRTGKTCGDCHREAYSEWQVSTHREAGLDCAACHDVHAGSIKANDSLALCATCHADRASNFAHAEHSQNGVTCVNCHLDKRAWTPGNGHSAQNHSFVVDLDTCMKCHDESLHQPTAYVAPAATPIPPDAMAAVVDTPVSDTPQPVGPLGFTALAGVVGLGFGVVLAPWIEKRVRTGKEK